MKNALASPGRRHQQRLATELQPVQARLLEARRALVTLLDGPVADSTAKPRLKKAERRKLVAVIQTLAGLALEEGTDAEVEAIFDRHSDVSDADLSSSTPHNQAYQADDLLTLLTLQLQTQQIDSLHLAGLPDVGLHHYNQVLREQLAALQQKLGECTAPFHVGMGLNQRERTPAVVDNALARDIKELRHLTRPIELDIAQLRDPATRRMAIANIEPPDDDDNEPDAFEVMLLMETFAGAPAFRPPRKKKRR